MAIVVGEFDLYGTVVEEFGGTVSGDLIHFVEALPSEVDRGAAIVDVQARLERAESDFAIVARPPKVEIVAIANVRLDNLPVADDLAFRRWPVA